jgi:hypothetical protein
MEGGAHHQGLLYTPLKIPNKGTPPPSSPRGPTERDAHPQGLLHVSFIKPSKGSPPSRFPSQSPHREGRAISKTHLYLSLKGPAKEPPTWFPKCGPHGKRCPSLGPSYIHLLITHLRAKNSVHQAEPPCLVRLHTIQLGGRLVSQRAPFRQTHPLPFIP